MAEWVYERVGPTSKDRVGHTLHRLDALSKRLQLKLLQLPGEASGTNSGMMVAIAGEVRTTAPREHKPPSMEVEKEREALYGIIVGMLKEAQELTENEELAKNAEARMSAMIVASSLTRAGEAVLRGYERGYVQPLVDELVSMIEQLKAQLRESDQEREGNGSTHPTS